MTIEPKPTKIGGSPDASHALSGPGSPGGCGTSAAGGAGAGATRLGAAVEKKLPTTCA